MLAGLFAGFGAAKAAPVVESMPYMAQIDYDPAGIAVDFTRCAVFSHKDGSWVSVEKPR